MVPAIGAIRGTIGETMNAGDTKAERIRKHAERLSARDERDRDAVNAVIDEENRRKASAAKTVRLREQRLARDAAEREAAAAAIPAPAKKARRRSATPAARLAVDNGQGPAT
ncbi:MAG: hypothetical protein ACHQAY_10150 [Hyphomicrobiales bacterium]